MKKFSFFILRSSTLFFLLILSLRSHADIQNPARSILQIHSHSKSTEVSKVNTARIALVDYDLLKKDFPFLTSMENIEIDKWIIENTGYISKTQVLQTDVNSKIDYSLSFKQAYRPPDYRRALVFQVENGMIDGKGFGSIDPYQGDHGNGLATLGETLREFIYQKLVQKIFDHSNSKYQTVGSYAVIDWGFRVKHADGSTSPAGAILRQAHKRASGTYSLLDDNKTIEIEKLLRKFGLTSAGAYRDRSTEKLNIQGTSDGAIIDFGGFLAVKSFSKAATSFYGSNILIQPGQKDFLQPDSELRIPLEIWGTSVSGKEDPKADNPWIWSHELAEAFAAQKAIRKDVDNHIRNLLEPVEKKLDYKSLNKCTFSIKN